VEIKVATILDPNTGNAEHSVTVSGNYYNNSPIPTSPTLELVTGAALSTRLAVFNAISENKYSDLTSHSEVSAKLIDVAPKQSRPFKLTFIGDYYFSTADPVAVFGAQIVGTQISVALTTPWYFKSSFQPSKLIVSTLLTTNLFHQVGQPIDTTAGRNEISKLNRTLDSLPNTAFVIVDPYLRDWLADFADTDIKDLATQLLERLTKFSEVASVYAQTDLSITTANELTSITSGSLASRGSSLVVYSPDKDHISQAALNAVAKKSGSIILLPNEVFGNSQQTTNAHGKFGTTDILISDIGLAACFELESELKRSACLTSLLTVITAESPNRARTILLPIKVGSDVSKTLGLLSEPASFNNTFMLASIESAFSGDISYTNIPVNEFDAPLLTTAMRKGLAQLLELSKSVDAVFQDQALARKLKATRYFALAKQSEYGSENLELVQAANIYANAQFKTLTLEGSSRITIPGTESLLPLTIVNGSEHVAKVGIQISSSLPGRISAANIDVVTIDPGKRVTVQVPIHVSGAGLIPIRASLTTQNNDSFGKPLAIQITSSAYQDIARNLVWTALALLVILLANSLRRRRTA
jgi:hypothetical protein